MRLWRRSVACRHSGCCRCRVQRRAWQPPEITGRGRRLIHIAGLAVASSTDSRRRHFVDTPTSIGCIGRQQPGIRLRRFRERDLVVFTEGRCGRARSAEVDAASATSKRFQRNEVFGPLYWMAVLKETAVVPACESRITLTGSCIDNVLSNLRRQDFTETK